jgi:hypothetical protein
VLRVRQLATFMKGPMLEALVSGDNRKRRERKVEGFIVPSVVVIVLEVVGKKLRLCKSE